MRTLSLSSLAVSAAAAAVLLVIPFYPPGIASTPEADPDSPTTVAEPELEAFARAFVAVAAAQQKIRRTPDTSEPRERTLAIKEEGEAEALTAISGAGLTLGRFKEILAAVAHDENLRTAVLASIQRERARIAGARAATAAGVASTGEPGI